MITSESEMVIDIAMSKKLPTMYADKESVVKGALASYGVSYYAFGRASAKNVQRILLGADPGDLPVEQLDRPHLVPQCALTGADEVIQ